MIESEVPADKIGTLREHEKGHPKLQTMEQRVGNYGIRNATLVKSLKFLLILKRAYYQGEYCD
jgi:hypothetical protein